MNKPLEKAYFNAGRDWYFERYEAMNISANRWFLAFCLSSLFCILLILFCCLILPLKKWIPFVVHQNTTTGEVWVDRPANEYVPANDAEVKADIVRYITTRESYTAADINQRFHLVMLLSDGRVAKEYSDIQSNSNKDSPVNVLGVEGARSIHVEDIVFIDKTGIEDLRHFRAPSQNLAKVDFTTTTLTPSGKTTTPWVATIGWIYKGLPNDESDAWDNWNGFSVTTYRLDPRNVEGSSTY